jgi:hypothetical protein
MAGRYDNPPKGKRSSSDPTMTQQANSGASKKAGDDLKADKKTEIDITDTKGPTPDLDAGTESVPVTARHAGEMSEMNGRHETEMRSMHTQQEAALRDMRKRHESERVVLRDRHDQEIYGSNPGTGAKEKAA